MSQERLMKVLLAPHVSEKSLGLGDANKQFVFRIDRTATKQEVKDAVELMFDVKVNDVRTVNVKGKTKGQTGRNAGRRANWKKAYVSLQDGFDIDFMGAE